MLNRIMNEKNDGCLLHAVFDILKSTYRHKRVCNEQRVINGLIRMSDNCDSSAKHQLVFS